MRYVGPWEAAELIYGRLGSGVPLMYPFKLSAVYGTSRVSCLGPLFLWTLAQWAGQAHIEILSCLDHASC